MRRFGEQSANPGAWSRRSTAESLASASPAAFFGYDFLQLLRVAPNYRRRGIGTALVKAWEESSHTPKLFTSTNESNVAMQRLCEQLGYVRSGVIGHLDEGDPEVVYFKPASDSHA